jgi:hypothetical protein
MHEPFSALDVLTAETLRTYHEGDDQFSLDDPQ